MATDTTTSHQGLEELSNQAFVLRAYVSLLGRQPEPERLRHHLGRLKAAAPRKEIWDAIAAEPQVGTKNRPVLQRAGEVPAVDGPNGRRIAPVPLRNLTTLHGEEFLRVAYRHILMREADSEGLTTYLGLLRAGYSQMHVLRGLAHSKEARGKPIAVQDLEPALKEYRLAQRRDLIGWYFRVIRGVVSDLPRDRELRSTLYRILEVRR